MKHSGRIKRGLTLLLAAVLLSTALTTAAYADTRSEELQNNVDAARSEYNAASNALNAAEQQTAQAQATVTQLNASSAAILEQINVINSQIDALNAQIAEKENEIAQRQADIDDRWQGFKARVAAMQELNDSGLMTMLSAVSNLYQFLTFGQTLQDISAKDTEVLEDMRQRKAEQEAAKQELETTQHQLEDTAAQLEEKQQQLAVSLRQANQALSEAQAAEAAQQLLTEETRKKWEQARAEQEAYVSSLLQSGQGPSLSCGMNFRPALNSYTYISTYFGVVDNWHSKPHGGTDFAAPKGTPIYATESGIVVIAKYSSSYGNYVTINHGTGSDGNSYATLYAHMTSYTVSVGQTVNRGDVIGYVGSTGNSTGNHLHLELLRNGTRIDPLLYIPTR